MKSRRPFLPANQHGSLLISLIVTLSVMAVAGAALVGLLTSSTYTSYAANRHLAAYYLAESGGRYAIPQIIADRDQAQAALDGKTYPFAGASQFSLAVDTTTSANYTYLTSIGTVNLNGWTEARADITYRIPTNTGGGGHSYFEYVLFANSTDAPALDLKLRFDKPVRGKVGTNGTASIANISLLDAPPVEHAGLALEPPPDPPAYPLPTQTIDITDIPNVAHPVPVVITSGSYTWNDIVLDGADILQLVGDVTIVSNLLSIGNGSDFSTSGNVTLVIDQIQTPALTNHINVSGNLTIICDRLYFESGPRLNIEPGSSVTVFANEEVHIQDGSLINTELATATPDQFTLYGSDTCDTITWENGVQFQGIVYAPYTDLVFQDTPTCTGTFVGDHITKLWGSRVLYPELQPAEPIIQYFAGQ